MSSPHLTSLSSIFYVGRSEQADFGLSESTSIPVNPRTGRPVGYAFVDLTTAEDTEKAISDLSGKEILERKVSVQVARKPDSAEAIAAAATAEPTSGGEGRKRGSGRGRGRGRGRGGRSGRGGRAVCETSSRYEGMLTRNKDGVENGENVETTDALPLTDVTNEANQAPPTAPKEPKPRTPRPPKQRGPPEDGIPSTTKVMVANLPYDLSEDKVLPSTFHHIIIANLGCSSRTSSPTTNLPLPRLPFDPFPDSW